MEEPDRRPEHPRVEDGLGAPAAGSGLFQYGMRKATAIWATEPTMAAGRAMRQIDKRSMAPMVGPKRPAAHR